MKSYRTQVRIPWELAEWIKGRACEEHRSINSQIVHYLEAQRQQEQENERKGGKK